jgi:hypothetical protein
MIQPPHDIFKSRAAARQVKCATTHSIHSQRVFNDESRWCGLRSVAAISRKLFNQPVASVWLSHRAAATLSFPCYLGGNALALCNAPAV